MQPGNVRNIQRLVEDAHTGASCEHLKAGNYTMLPSFSKARPKEIIRISTLVIAVLRWRCIYDSENRNTLIKKGKKMDKGVLSE